jgi:hypothetical protein
VPAQAALWLGALAVALLLPFAGFGLLSEDSAALAYASEQGAFADWLGPQYDLRQVRFWRPLVTATLALQQQLGGTDAVWLRSLNLACHGVSTAALVLIAAELGAGRAAAAAAGVWAACSPLCGGAVLWVVGRVDCLCAAPLLLAVWSALRGRTWIGLCLGFLALCSKELGVALPAWVFLAAWARGDGARGALRCAAPGLLLCGAYLCLRWAVLGTVVGGYSGVALGPASFAPALAAWAGALGGASGLACIGALGIAALVLGLGRIKPAACGLLCALASAAPAAHALASGTVAAEHRRTLYLSDLALGLTAAGLLVARTVEPRSTRIRLAVPIALAVLVLARAPAHLADARAWREAGRLADSIEQRTRAALAGAEPSGSPVVAAEVPRVHGGAYVFQWGFAERFEAPFDPTPRPVWPWRNVYALGEPERRRPSLGAELGAPEAGVRDPFAARAGPLALHGVEGGRPCDALRADARLFEGLGAPGEPPRLAVSGLSGVESIEWLLLTPLGYEPGGAWHLPPDASDGLEIDLRAVLVAPIGQGFASFADLVLDALDARASVLWLELRAVPRGGGEPWAAHLRLELDPALRDLARPLRR